ncbi:hypothetical protein ACH5RR_032309 [Cinchona calisaya]|uniref:Uncharacterized protein n=1 Tax=Cinchona calisaya TaxID=153742 RepID=A0ABD2YM42_9GENT
MIPPYLRSQHPPPTKMWTTSGNNSALTSTNTSTGRVTRDKKAGVATSTIDSTSGSGVQMVVTTSRTKSNMNTSTMGKVQRMQTRFGVQLFSSQGSSNNENQTKTTK